MRFKYGWLVVLLAGCKLSATGSLLGPTPATTSGTPAPGRPASSGSELVTMPDLFLMTRAEAEAAVARAGFERGVGLDTSSICGSAVDGKVIELGRVCSQSPAAGQKNSPRVPIRIRVQHESPWRGQLGGGRSWFLMPDLVGVPVEQAKQKLRSLGFVSKEVKIAYVDDRGCAPNTVCKTVPEGLSRADNTSDKLFYVGRPPAAADSKQPE